MKKILIFCLVLTLFSCVNGQWRGITGYMDHVSSPKNESATSIDTSNITMPPSGSPGVTICGIDKKDFIERMMASASEFGDSDINIKATEYEIIISKHLEGYRNSYMYGSRYNTTPDQRIIMTVANKGDGCIYVGGRSQIVTNPNSPHERITDTTKGQDGKELQAVLEKIKAKYEYVK